MTPAEQQAIDRLTRTVDPSSGYPVCRGCGYVWLDGKPEPDDGHAPGCDVATLLSLLRPVASVEAPEPLAEATTVVQRDDVDGNFIDPPRMAVPRAQAGSRARVVVLPE